MIEHLLNGLVVAGEQLLCAAWSHHLRDNDILVLGDNSRKDIQEFSGSFWRSRGQCPTLKFHGRRYVAYLQPAALLDALERSSPDQAAAARELRGFAEMRHVFNAVPLFVVTKGGHWATHWAPPGSDVEIVRFDPVDQETN